MTERRKTDGYYHLSIGNPSSKHLMQSNSERAYVLSQIQDILNPHFVLTDVPLRLQLVPSIDLLAFHIGAKSIELLVFAIDREAAYYFALTILKRLEAYHNDYYLQSTIHPYNATITLHQLDGIHNALVQSLIIHRMSTFWERDRYSSVGFYLFDRRGDWMRIWRLTQLYDNKPKEYLRMLRGRNDHAAMQTIRMPKSFHPHEPLSHA